MEAYINDLAYFLPNDPVTNEDIEKVLGKIRNVPSRVKSIVLRNNKIKTRYYAIDRETGRLTHTNAGLIAEAVRRLKPEPDFDINSIECFCTGTSSPDVMLPGQALMALGELGIPDCEAVSTSGICISGMTALKYACMNVATGMSANAVATGSELSSSVLRAKFYSEKTDLDLNIESPSDDMSLEESPELAFNADFLRWMLSDGAGAAYISRTPNKEGISLKVDWIENVSYAGQFETCQYMGATKMQDGSITGWREYDILSDEEREHIMAIKQDIKLLNKHIIPTMIDMAFNDIVKKRDLQTDDIKWFLPHYSSGYFREIIYEHLVGIGFEIPYEKWFTNLYEKGNTGSASIYIILEELFKSGRLIKGDKILCLVPESGRFSHCYMMLTVV